MAPAGLATEPSLVEWKNMSFLIMDAPKDSNLHIYLRYFRKHNVVRMVRVCTPSYDVSDVRAAGIEISEMEYDDGDAPPQQIITQWLDVVHATFKGKPNHTVGQNGGDTNGNSGTPPRTGAGKVETVGSTGPTIAIHCVAGLGRAPVLVAIALIEDGMQPMEAVEYIREKRRGSINNKQLQYLQHYQRLRTQRCGGFACSIM